MSTGVDLEALTLNLKSRGMNAPRLAIGDGAMGFWSALEEVYGETRQQRCWMHYANFRIMPTFLIQSRCPAVIAVKESA